MNFVSFQLRFKDQAEASRRDEWISLLCQQFKCQGVEEISLDEEKVDEIIGTEAYCGGNLPESSREVLEQEVERSLEMKAYFQSGTEGEFEKWIEESSVLEVINKDVIQNQDWNEAWRSSFERIDISGKLSVIPEWEKSEGDDENSAIYIYPGMGFGTGGHETTRLCLEFLLEDLLPENFPRVLDLGCGSGILGIALAKTFQSEHIYMVDIDSDALDNTLHNISVNPLTEGKSAKFHCVTRSDFKSSDKFDFIFANILLEVLTKESEFIRNNLQSGGFLVLSGILNEQVSELKECFSSLKLIGEKSLGDWSALMYRKP